MRLFALFLLSAGLWGFSPARALAAEESLPLAGIIEEYEHNEAELARLKEQLESARATQEAARLRARVEELERRQEELAQTLEKIVGPAPAAVSHEKPVPLEGQMDTLETRHETTLEKDVEQRLK